MLPKRSSWLALIGLLLCFSVLLLGAKSVSKSSYRVGVVDLKRVFEKNSDMANLRLEWMGERGDLMQKGLTISESGSKQEKEALLLEAKKSQQELDKKTTKERQRVMDLLRASATRVGQEKGIDLILIKDVTTGPLNYFEGEDLTLDLLLDMESEKRK